MNWRRLALLVLCSCWPSSLGCEPRANKTSQGRSDAVTSASVEMSGPSLLSQGRLAPALQALRAKAAGRPLRLEVRARELMLQVEDTTTPGTVVELHYKDGKISEPEQATLRGKGQLADNLFDYADVNLDAIAGLSRQAALRVDAENGKVDYVLVRRNLPDTDDVRMRVYVQSPRKSGYIDADKSGQPL